MKDRPDQLLLVLGLVIAVLIAMRWGGEAVEAGEWPTEALVRATVAMGSIYLLSLVVRAALYLSRRRP